MATIKFIREYDLYGSTFYDVVYGKPGNPSRLYMYSKDRLPKTVKKWLENKIGDTQYNKVFKRDEIVYTTEPRYRVEFDFRVNGKYIHDYLDNNGKGFCKEDAVHVGKQLVAQGNTHVMVVTI